MMRHTLVGMLVASMTLTALLSPAAAQDAPRSKSLIERFGAIRFGWGAEAEEEKAEPKQPSPRRQASNQPQAKQPQIQRRPVRTLEQQLATSRPSTGRVATSNARVEQSLPRIDPRTLLPKDFQGPKPQLKTASRSRVPVAKPEAFTDIASQLDRPAASRQPLGSVRDRILRDLRQQEGATTAEARKARTQAATPSTKQRSKAGGSSPRAGSVLSGGDALSGGQLRGRIRPEAVSSDFLRQSSISSREANAAPESNSKAGIGKSIAAEVAERMATTSPSPEAAASEPAEAIAAEKTPAKAEPKAAPVVEAKPEPTVPVETKPEPSPVSEAPAVEQSVAQAKAHEAKAIAPEPAPAVKEEVITVPSPTVAVAPVSPTPSAANVDARGPITSVSAAPTRISLEPGAGPTPVAEQPVVKMETASIVSDQARMTSSFDAPAARGKAQLPGMLGRLARRDDLLIKQQTPQVTANVVGPRKVVIGRPAAFQVQMGNSGAAAANGLEARVEVPEWAEIAKVETSTGRVESPTLTSAGRILWRIDRFAAGGQATMDVTLVARSGRPIELGVDWTHAPVSSRALVEVQEPKLELHLAGPDEVHYGKSQLFRLTLSNPGTGVAEEVALLLAPPGKPIEQATRHPMGDLAPGATKSIEIELTAREAGQLALAARATAVGGVEAGIDKQLFCRKPEIEVDWRGPKQKYTNAQATYYFRVRNAGTAAAESVTFDVTLPEGFEMTSASDGQSFDSRRRLLQWRVGSLRPGDDYYMELKGVARTAGDKGFQVMAATGDKLVSDTLVATTKVIAVADLKLDVRDPKGPLPVGADAVYEVRVSNRGSNVAESIDVVALFSGGIEPQEVEGRQCRIADGRVSLPTIESLAVGEEVVLRIHAKAVEAGTHVFRAEVSCRDLEIRLAAEEMTRFYNDDSGLPGAARAAAADRFNRPR